MQSASPTQRLLTAPRVTAIIFGVALVVAMIYALSPQLDSLTTRTFPFNLPTSAELIDSHESQAGFDSSQGYCFRVQDDQLLDLLVKHWKLAKTTDPRDPATSFLGLEPPPGWPTADRLANYPEQYEREVTEGGERYWSVWVDRELNLLWAEKGKW